LVLSWQHAVHAEGFSPKMGFDSPPARPYGYYSRPSQGASNIRDLILGIGANRAQGYERSGQIWGNTLTNLGASIGSAITEHAQAKEMAKQDAAMTAIITGWDGQDSKVLLNSLTKVLGPTKGPAMAKTVMDVYQPPKEDPKQELAFTATALELAGQQSDDVMARVYPGLRQRLLPTLGKLGFSEDMLPPDWTPELRDPMAKMAQVLSGEKPKEKKLTTVAPGSSIYDEEGNLVTTAPSKPEEPKRHKVTVPGPGGRPIEKLVTEEELSAGVPSYQAPTRDDRIVQIMGPGGTPIWAKESAAVGQPAAQAARAVTGQERTALAFFNRAKEAVDNIAPIEKEVAGSGLAGQAQLKYAPNLLQTEAQQAYSQAQRAFTEARLRKESGAAIPKHEYENDAKTYFAQPGDSASTIEQKRKARQTVLDGLAFGAGKAYEEFYGEGYPRPAIKTDPKAEAARLRGLYGAK